MYIIQKTGHFDDWLKGLRDIQAKAKILARLKRVELGNLGDAKSVGDGVHEMRIDCGPGYMIYFVRLKGIIILLLVGGDKSTQAKDIKKAKQLSLEIGG